MLLSVPVPGGKDYMKVWRAKKENSKALINLFLELTSHLKSITKKEVVHILPNKVEELLKSNELKGTKIILVAGERKEIKGFIIGYVLDLDLYKIAVVDDIYVSKEQRKKGIGKKLVDNFIKECHKHKIKTIFAITPLKNKIAKEFFQDIGFKKLHSMHFYLKI